MSFFSSLILFYPGTPPAMKGVDLLRMATALRTAIGVQPESLVTLNLKWGKRIDQDYGSTNQCVWDESAIMGTMKPFNWDIEMCGVPWPDLSKGVLNRDRNVYRAFFDLGMLTEVSNRALTAVDPSSDDKFIAPDGLSIQVGPICPSTLSTEDRFCTGLVSVHFAGNGYFTWRDLGDHADAYSKAQPVLDAMRICRDEYPVHRDARFERIAEHLQDMFLNRKSYKDGDWILSVAETG